MGFQIQGICGYFIPADSYGAFKVTVPVFLKRVGSDLGKYGKTREKQKKNTYTAQMV
jgi:hypothetical protein